MRWTVRLEARTDQGEVETTELVTFSRPAIVNSLAEIGLSLAEAKALLAGLQASMLCGQVAEYAGRRRVCPECGVLQPLKGRRTRRLQTLFGTVEVEAPRFRVCRCRPPAPTAAVTFSPVRALLTARCTPELERAQAELGRGPRSGRRPGYLKPCCPPRRRTMRACAPAPMPSPCGSRRPTGSRLRRPWLPGMDRRPQGPTRAAPLSCSMAPMCVRCRATRSGTSRRSAAGSGAPSTTS